MTVPAPAPLSPDPRPRHTETLTPGQLYQRITECHAIICEANRRLIALRSRPMDICTCFADVPPFTWKKKPKKKSGSPR
jgi:hypothetical protein